MKFKIASTHEEIESCFELISLLRPHLSKSDFIMAAIRMSEALNYKLIFLDDNGIKAVAGFRISEWLHTGKYLEIEELVTKEGERSKGYGGQLFDWLSHYAATEQCRQIRLVSGVKRENAHQFYLNKGMQYEAKYFSINI